MATAEFSKFAGILSAALSQHHLSGFEIAQLNSITSTSFVCSDGWLYEIANTNLVPGYKFPFQIQLH